MLRRLCACPCGGWSRLRVGTRRSRQGPPPLPLNPGTRAGRNRIDGPLNSGEHNLVLESRLNEFQFHPGLEPAQKLVHVEERIHGGEHAFHEGPGDGDDPVLQPARVQFELIGIVHAELSFQLVAGLEEQEPVDAREGKNSRSQPDGVCAGREVQILFEYPRFDLDWRRCDHNQFARHQSDGIQDRLVGLHGQSIQIQAEQIHITSDKPHESGSSVIFTLKVCRLDSD